MKGERDKGTKKKKRKRKMNAPITCTTLAAVCMFIYYRIGE